MLNIKKSRSGRNGELCISWYENPRWSKEHKQAERRYQKAKLKNFCKVVE